MTEPEYRLQDLGDRRVLTVGGQEHTTPYSERVVRMLIERKGARRAALYFPFKETRGRHFLAPLFAYLRGRAARDLSVLEVGCSFGHITEYLAEQPEVGRISTFDTDPDFIAMLRAKVEDQGLSKVRDLRHLGNDETRRLPYADAAFDLVLAIGVVEHLPPRHRRAQVDEYYRVLRPGGRLALADMKYTDRQVRRLSELGMLDVERRSLGWRMWWGGPWAPTRLVTATKPRRS